MERITNVSQLKKGDVIVNVRGNVITMLEFREIHPHNDAYSVMLNESHDGAPKFYNKRLEEEEWYLYTSGNEQWKELYQIVINNLNKSISSYQGRIKKLEEKIEVLQETLLPDEFLVRCYEDNQLCYSKGEVYVAKLIPGDGFHSDKFLKVWYHGSKVCNGRREGSYNDIFVSPLQQGNIFSIGNFERIS